MTTKHNGLAEIRAHLVSINEKELAISAAAATEGRDLTEAELSELESLKAQFEKVEASLARLEEIEARAEKLNAPLPRVTQPVDPQASAAPAPSARISGGMKPGASEGMNGFVSAGEFLLSVRSAMRPGGTVDGRLMASASTYGSEATQADGGFAVPPDFRSAIMKQVLGESSLLTMTDQQFTSSNKLTIPNDTTTPWQTSGGVLAAWENEAATLPQTKPSIGQTEVKLAKVTALVPMTDELLEDVPAMSQYLPGKVAEKFVSKVNDAIVNGTGVGQPLGLLNSGAQVSVAKESGQAAATLAYNNIVKMWSRLYAPLRSGAVWLINQDIEPQLLALTAPGGYLPAYLGPNGISGSPYGTLLGRPVIPVEACQTLGTEGDIILTNLKSYLSVQKVGGGAGGIRQDVSMHVYFDQGVTAFRFVMRVGGQSWWNAAISKKNGSNTMSNIVSLATRS